jgi:hypothetical protein
MAGSYGSRRYYKNYYRNKYRYKYGGSSSSRRSYGNIKAAKQQTDNATFTINIPSKADNIFCQTQNIQGETNQYGVYALNIYDLLRRSEFYSNYANMYDEFKIDNIKVKLLPTSWTRTTGEGISYSNLTVYTAWDRSGLNDAQLKLITSGTYNDELIPETQIKNNQLIGKNGDQDGLYCIVGEDITTYSSAESRQVNPNTNSSITRWLKPKTISEKSQWLSTASLKKWYNDYVDGGYKGIPTGDMKEIGNPELVLQLAANPKTYLAYLARESPAVANNPCFLKEDASISFKPTLLIGLYPASNENSITPDSINFNIEAEVVCTFRGLRKAKVV